METENTSQTTKSTAKQIAEELGAKHSEVDFEDIYLSFKNIGKDYSQKELRF
jgi:tRNA U34 2-thiouridine synthase MnmA/TrmU